MSIAKQKIKNIQFILLIIGLVLIIIANLFELDLLKVEVDSALANLGVLLFLIGGIQWLYDISVRQQLYEEITSLTIKNVNVVTSGIVDVLIHSKDVNYSDLINQSTELCIGLNYSPRILEHYINDFRNRAKNGLNTKIIAIDLETSAGQFLISLKNETDHIAPNLKKLQVIADEINSLGSGKIEVVFHSSVLRYSFVQTDSSIWIKPYRNSAGRESIPAIKLRSGSNLHKFYDLDIKDLFDQASKG
jgi:hypothetical protein